jgi:hypothetical protein
MLHHHSVQVSLPLDISARSNGLQFSSASGLRLAAKSRGQEVQGHRRSKPRSGTGYGDMYLIARADYRTSKNVLSSGGSIKSLSSSASIKSARRSAPKSSRSSIRTVATAALAPIHLLDMPLEIIDLILSCLDQKALVKFLYVSQRARSLAIPVLYRQPYFSTTYRLAQFVTVIASNLTLAALVRILDLSHLANPVDAGTRPLAGWRDWKLRSEPLYTMRVSVINGHGSKAARWAKPETVLRKDIMKSNETTMTTSPCFKSYHPLQSPLLKQFSFIKDVPTGYLMHILNCCNGIVGINLSSLPLAIDYRVESAAYKQTYLDNQQFVSDLPKSCFEPGEVSPLTAMDLFKVMMTLENLQFVTITNVTWLTREIVSEFLRNSAAVRKRCLEYMDLQKSGMARNLPWATLGTPTDIQSALDN